MLRPLIVVLALAALVAIGRPATDRADGERRTDTPQAGLLRTGEARYAGYVRAERASLRERERAGDPDGARIHLGRLAPARSARSGDPLEVVRAAAAVVSLDARDTGRRGLLDVEMHAAGAGVAFDSVRDAVWARDRGLVGAVDERLAGVRAELDRHRRGEGFLSSGALETGDRRRLAAALDALAWRLSVAVALLETEPVEP